LSCLANLASADTSRGLRIPYPVHTRYGYGLDMPRIHIWSHYLNLDTGVAGYVYPVRLGRLWIQPNRVFGPFSPCTVYPKPSIQVFLFPVTQPPPLYERMKPPSWRRRLPRPSPLPLRVKTVGNGRENPLTIFARISFYSIGNGNGKVRNGIRSVKSGPSKTDKTKQKCLGIDRQTVI
jgi:hypothetical protein